MKVNLIVRPMDSHQRYPSPSSALPNKRTQLTFPDFVDTPPQNLDTLPFIQSIIPPLVHRAQGNVHSHPMRGIWDDRLGAEVVDPVQVGKGGGDVETGKEEVDGVW